MHMLGFDHRQINHIEVARTCATEMSVCRRLAEMKIKQQVGSDE